MLPIDIPLNQIGVANTSVGQSIGQQVRSTIHLADPANPLSPLPALYFIPPLGAVPFSGPFDIGRIYIPYAVQAVVNPAGLPVPTQVDVQFVLRGESGVPYYTWNETALPLRPQQPSHFSYAVGVITADNVNPIPLTREVTLTLESAVTFDQPTIAQIVSICAQYTDAGFSVTGTPGVMWLSR